VKRIVCLGLAIILFSSFSFLAFSQQEKKDILRFISTNGTAKVWVEPDRARVFLGVETMAENVSLAREENATKIKNVIDALEALRIKGMLIKAPSYNVQLVKEREYDASKAGRLPKVLGYKVTQNFTVLLQDNDIARLSKNAALVLDTALDKGVNLVQDIMFFKEDDSKERRKALDLAVKDAIDNAKAIAQTAVVSIKKYTMINSSINIWFPRHNQMRQVMDLGEARGTPTTLVAGRVAVNSQAQLQCEIE
jgi:uncharacterized protein YggE